MLAICLCFCGYRPQAEKTAKILATVLIFTAAIFFILLFPYASGLNVSAGWLSIGKKILRIWY